jgi:hypothetical protein
MPVTAKLSKRFYDQLGDEVANELVTWFNAVEDAYRTDLRIVNDSTLARFDAKLEQRFAEQDARIERRFAEQDVRIEKRLAEQDARFEKRFADQDVRFEKRFADQDIKLERLGSELRSSIDRLETTMERSLKDQTRWMFFAWATLFLAVIGIGLR